MTLATVALALAACGRLKEPATQAVAQAESSLAAVREEAAQYAPSELQQAETSVASLKESLAKNDYKAVMAAAPQVTQQLNALKETVAQKSTEALAAAKQQWDSLSADVPQMVEAIQSRVSTLQASRKLPANVTKDALQSAADGLTSLKDLWSQATALSGSGKIAEAVAKAQEAKTKGMEVLGLLGMNKG
jgi:hypothetical protein